MKNKSANQELFFHQLCGQAVEVIMKTSLSRKTLDNITVVLISFKNLKKRVLNDSKPNKETEANAKAKKLFKRGETYSSAPLRKNSENETKNSVSNESSVQKKGLRQNGVASESKHIRKKDDQAESITNTIGGKAVTMSGNSQIKTGTQRQMKTLNPLGPRTPLSPPSLSSSPQDPPPANQIPNHTDLSVQINHTSHTTTKMHSNSNHVTPKTNIASANSISPNHRTLLNPISPIISPLSPTIGPTPLVFEGNYFANHGRKSVHFAHNKNKTFDSRTGRTVKTDIHSTRAPSYGFNTPSPNVPLFSPNDHSFLPPSASNFKNNKKHNQQTMLSHDPNLSNHQNHGTLIPITDLFNQNFTIDSTNTVNESHLKKKFKMVKSSLGIRSNSHSSCTTTNNLIHNHLTN